MLVLRLLYGILVECQNILIICEDEEIIVDLVQHGTKILQEGESPSRLLDSNPLVTSVRLMKLRVLLALTVKPKNSEEHL